LAVSRSRIQTSGPELHSTEHLIPITSFQEIPSWEAAAHGHVALTESGSYYVQSIEPSFLIKIATRVLTAPLAMGIFRLTQ